MVTVSVRLYEYCKKRVIKTPWHTYVINTYTPWTTFDACMGYWLIDTVDVVDIHLGGRALRVTFEVFWEFVGKYRG